MSYKDLLVVMAVGLSTFIHQSRSCDLTAVTSCTSILGRDTNITVMNEGLSAIPSVEQLTALCRSLGDFKACYEPKAAACNNDVIFSMTFGTVQKTIAYLCEEGFNDILQYASCWNRTEVTVETTQCHVEQSDMITSLQQQSGQMNSTQMREGWCEILSNTTSCMSNVVEQKCGAGPACIMHTMMARALEGLSGLMQCPAPEECNVKQFQSSAGPELSTETYTKSSSAELPNSFNVDSNNEAANNFYGFECLMFSVFVSTVLRTVQI